MRKMSVSSARYPFRDCEVTLYVVIPTLVARSRTFSRCSRSALCSITDPSLSTHPSVARYPARKPRMRSEEHTSELQSLMRISYAVFCLKKKKNKQPKKHKKTQNTSTTT